MKIIINNAQLKSCPKLSINTLKPSNKYMSRPLL
jgi:hypothetical protein